MRSSFDDLDYQLQAVNFTVERSRGLSRRVDGIYCPDRIRKTAEGDPTLADVNNFIIEMKLVQVHNNHCIFFRNRVKWKRYIKNFGGYYDTQEKYTIYHFFICFDMLWCLYRNSAV